MLRIPSQSTVYLYAHTLARMQPRQLAGIAERKIRGVVVPAIPVDFDRRYDRNVPDDLRVNLRALRANTEAMRDSLEPETRREYGRRARAAANGAVTFMNRTRTVTSGERIDWDGTHRDDVPRLWQLKLYGFEPLAWTLFSDDGGDAEQDVRTTFEEWVSDWINTVEIGTPNYLRGAWTPYAVSLRVLYWTRYLACRDRDGGADAFDTALARELYKNASFLANHVEYDVGGNHLLENGAGLVAAGTLFGDDGDAWVTTGVSVLKDAAESQFLDDGCHFERSPMYHIQALTRYLTARDLLTRSGRPVPDSIEQTVSEGVAFLEFLRPPDGELPLLNDAVHGQTLSVDACLAYARATGVDLDEKTERAPSASTSQSVSRIKDSAGLGWLDTDVGRMLVDGGPVGPPHLPGHAHSDLLSYLLWLDDKPVVTDTGTFDYERGERRRYARGVQGHNTVQIGEVEPVELGGRFLMGPRPTPAVRWDTSGDVAFFEGSYIARPFRRPTYAHHRSIAAGEHWWLVWDRVRGHDEGTVRSRIHLHPDVAVSRADAGALRIVCDDSETGHRVAWLHPVGSKRVVADRGPYFPEFGMERDRTVVTVESAEASVPNAFGYVMTTVDKDPPDVSTDPQGRPTAVTFESETHTIPTLQIPLHTE